MSFQRIGFYSVALLTVISGARADTVSIQELTAGQFALIFPSATPTFNGIGLPMNGVQPEPGGLMVGSVLFGDLGNANLNVIGPGLADIGTAPHQLLIEDDGTPANNINMTFAHPVAVVGLIAGDGLTGGGADTAIFNVTFGNASTENGIGSLILPLLPMAGGLTPTYFAISDIGGSGISQVNFADSAGFPTLDTVTTAPEPNTVWLLAVPILALGIGSVIRKRKTAAARLGSGAAPLALLAVLAILAVPSSSFAQPVNCNLAVPNNPLTAAGLATPYILSPGDANCSQSAATMAFVQAAIYDPAAHTISVYTPLVADPPSGSPLKKPRYVISPVVPNLPANATVAIWFGYNANNLTLTGPGVTSGNCFTFFGQYAACNTTAFWAAVNADPTLQTNIWNAFKGQTGSDGQACPTSRSFSIVDQDPTDNLPVSFLLTTEAQPRTAQDTVANRAKFVTMFGALGTGWNVQINPSDEVVVDKFIDGALGCNPPVTADLTDPGTTRASLAVNELFAGLQSGQFTANNIYGNGSNQLRGPGLVAIGDTFTLQPTFTQPNGVATCVTTPTTGECTYPYTGGDIGAFDAYVAAMGYTGQTNPQTISGTLQTGAGTAFARTNQYRASTNQPLASVGSTMSQDGSTADASVQTFCTKMFTRTAVGDNSPADLLFNKDLSAFNHLGNGPGGPNSTLFIFLGDRFAASYDLLGCAAVFGQPNPVNVTNVNATTPGGPVLPYYPAVFPVP